MQWEPLSIPAEFVSLYPLSETIARLREASSSSPFSLQQAIDCEFDGTKVKITRSILFVSNRHSPVFVGSFREDARGVVLSGQFAVRRWVIIHQNIGLILATFLAVAFTLTAFTQLRTLWPVPLVAPCVLALIYGQTKVFERLARGDIAWVSHRIVRAIGDPPESSEPPPPPPGWLRRSFNALSGQ